VEEHIRGSYQIRVLTRDVPDPLTGDLDGAEIHIDHLVTSEERLFLLAHLFGHTVQWNVNPRAFEIGQPQTPPVPQERLPGIIEYEREAASYALGMFHEVGITELDQWLSDYTAADMAYLGHYYRTGEKRDFRSFWKANSALIEPRPVPRFTPSKRVFRLLDGIVI
jgi:hypothetical protein